MKWKWLLLVCMAVLLLGAFGTAQAASVSLDHVDGMVGAAGDSVIQMGGPVTFYIRLTGDANGYAGITNGFRVFSPDGATWDTTTAVNNLDPSLQVVFDLVWRMDKRSVDGALSDTIGFGGAAGMNYDGMWPNYDGVPFAITVGPIGAAYEGDRLCLDSAFYPPSGKWKWATTASGSVTPEWSGPHCFWIGSKPSGPVPTIACPGEPLSVYLCELEPYCIPLEITNADEVTFEGPGTTTWADGQLCFTPPSAGTHHVIVTATNGEGSVNCDITFIVTLNRPPVAYNVSSPVDTLLCSAGTICYDFGAADPDGQAVTWEMVSGPGAIDHYEGLWCFTAEEPGTYAAQVHVLDPCGAADTVTLQYNIEFNSAPVAIDPVSPVDTFLAHPATISFQFEAGDADEDPLIWSKYLGDGTISPSGLWQFTAATSGTYSIEAEVADDCGVSDITTLTYNVTVNSAPELSLRDTTICADSLFELVITAVDADEEPVYLWIAPLLPNMTFVHGEGPYGVLTFTPGMDQIGEHSIGVFASDMHDTTMVELVITVVDCTPPCSEMILSHNELYFEMYENAETNPASQFFTVSSSGTPFCFEVYPDASSWLWVDLTSGCTEESVEVEVNGLELGIGTYEATIAVVGGSGVCEPATHYVTVHLTVLVPPSEDDMIGIPTLPAVPGSRVIMPITIENLCDLSALDATFTDPSDHLGFDSISFVGSVIAGWAEKSFVDGHLTAAMSPGENPVPAGKGILFKAFFRVKTTAPHGWYPISGDAAHAPMFEYDCGAGTTQVIPSIHSGGIVVGSATNYVCGYVVDPDYHPIEGATVELWPDFPYGAFDDQTWSDHTGLFEFFNSEVVPFDLYAYKPGYYPAKVEDLDFGTTGIMIVLTPVTPFVYTDQWVNFYCADNTYLDAPLPVGSVIDAYDPDGVHCGQYYVTEPGRYGFMPVYHDDAYTLTDEGADPGDELQFYVNGMPAVTDVPAIWTSNGDVRQVCIDAGHYVEHYCDLREGWNLVSWNVDHASDRVEDVFGSVMDCLEVVMGFEQGGLVYDPTEPEFSTLHYADHLSGYWVRLSCDARLMLVGTEVPVNTSIPLTEGWNLVSYLPEDAMAPEHALTSVLDYLTVALGWDGEGLVYEPGEEEYNTLDEMHGCAGYWLKVQHGGTLQYPGIGPVLAPQVDRNMPLALGKVGAPLAATNSWVNVFSRNLTVNGEAVPAGAQIVARDSRGNVVGGFVMDKPGRFGFMPVYGDDPTTEAVDGVVKGETFTLEVNGTAANEVFAWADNGEKIEIVALTAKGADDGPSLPMGYSLQQNYPNPFNPSTTLRFSLPSATQARIEVYNILGRLVSVPFDGMATAGENSVEWNGTNSSGEPVASGVYFYRLTADKYTETRKMTLLK